MKKLKYFFLSFFILFLGCAEKETLVQYKAINHKCPTIKIQKEDVKDLNLSIKILKIKNQIYIALPKKQFLIFVANYKKLKYDLNNTYNTIQFFNEKVKKLNKN